MSDPQRKLPAIQWYPGDWRKDPGVQALDYLHRGVWFEVLMLMHESEDRGRLKLNGRPMPHPAAARLLGIPVEEWTTIRVALLEYGVADEDDEGALICRRMVRDETLRRTRSEAGRRGGKASSKGQTKSKQKSSKREAKPQAKGQADNPRKTRAPGTYPQSKTEAEAKQNVTSSVSSSVSTSVTDRTKEASTTPEETAREQPPDDVPIDRSDGLTLMVDEFPEAGVVLEGLTHAGGKHATAATLRSAFLFPSEDRALVPDASVKGLDSETRRRLVAGALLEFRDQGETAWARPLFAGFVRRIRQTPEIGETIEPEEARVLAETRQRTLAEDETAKQRMADEGRELHDQAAEAKAWVEQQPEGTQLRVGRLIEAGLSRLGFGRNPKRAPPYVHGPVLVDAVAKIRAEELERSA